MSALTRTEINCLCARSYLRRLVCVEDTTSSEIWGAVERSLFADRQMLRLAVGRAAGAKMVEIIFGQNPDHSEWTTP